MRTKKEIDELLQKADLKKCKVSCEKLKSKDLLNYKMCAIANKDTSSNSDEPAKKKPKMDINIIENTEEVPIDTNENESNESSNSSANIVFKENEVVDPRITMSSSTSKNEIASISTEEMPIETNENESNESSNSSANIVFKENEAVDPRITMSSSKLKNEIASTSTKKVPIVSDCEKSTKSSNSSNVLPEISVIDPRKMMDNNQYIKYINEFLYNTPHSTNAEEVENALNKNVKLIEIQKLYGKYFSKFVQDTVAITANLYIIYATIYKQYIARIEKTDKKESEAEKRKKKIDAKLVLDRQKKILEKKVETNITNVVSLFFESEFEKAFQMFFLSILIVLRVLKQPQSCEGDVFKDVSQFLLNSLKNCEDNGSRIISILQSNDFRLDCTNTMLEIEDSKDNNPGIADRLTLFFITSENSQKYFQKIIDAIVNESAVNLEILIDEASFHCSVNSVFKDPIFPSTVQKSNDELPVTNTIQSSINSDGQIQHSLIPKCEDETFQRIPGLNQANKSQAIGNTAVEPSIVMDQPLKLLSQFCPKTHIPKAIPIKEYSIVFPNNFVNLSDHATSSSATIAQLTNETTTQSIQNNDTNGPNNEADRITIADRDQQSGPSRQMKRLNITCHMKYCDKNVKVTCSICQMVKYCSLECQQSDWFVDHINNCDQLLNTRTQGSTSQLHK